ncbi:type II secretion system minor pseudopilin GspK [Geomonas paludis]|uniref:Type II secretion system minor pseudopilin GspK n=1 Tax=Geomonas paludis TaxID=2740185 RepID=A0A6V8MSG7_9BACT|nr:type II secretion system minor pseudopilin GspK [Geomonas paludis]UPU35458.1 type II secretion system minor pseudopilin GspK [Geomonas paludis]GFO62972.1 type II secretion system protein K [Geomonas paludis]
MRGQRGFALVIALIVTTLLVALLAEFVNEVYVDTSHSHNFVASQQAGVMAESGIAGGIKLLQLSASLRRANLDTSSNFSSLLELWAQPRSLDADNGTVTVTIEEESGKIDLNAATSQTGEPVEFSKNALLRLFDNLKLSRDLYDALADWADTDDMPRPSGADKSYYGSLKQPHQVHNNKLETVEELALIKGFTPEVVAKLKNFVTVYGTANGVTDGININTAPKEVLMSLNDDLMRGSGVSQILEYRKTKVIKSSADVFGSSPLAIALSPPWVGFKGSIYRIRSEGKVGECISVVEAVVTNVENAPPTILYWREY